MMPNVGHGNLTMYMSTPARGLMGRTRKTSPPYRSATSWPGPFVPVKTALPDQVGGLTGNALKERSRHNFRETRETESRTVLATTEQPWKFKNPLHTRFHSPFELTPRICNVTRRWTTVLTASLFVTVSSFMERGKSAPRRRPRPA